MEDDRKRLYARLEGMIGNTPLVRYSGEVPSGSSVWIKRECDNPFGSHYDRVYLALYRHFEEEKGLKPGMSVLETSSGSAGVSFAGIGRFLGYDCHVMIPDGNHLKKRRDAIEEHGGKLILTPEEEYIGGFTKRRVVTNMMKHSAIFLNHSAGPNGTNNEITLKALGGIATEVLRQQEIGAYVCGIGNGSSIVGPGRVFKEHDSCIRIFGYKPKISGKSDFPGLINQDGLDSSERIFFPHIAEADRMMDKEVLIDGEGVCGVGGELTKISDHWDIGRTGKAGIQVALSLAAAGNACGDMLVLAYDKAERY